MIASEPSTVTGFVGDRFGVTLRGLGGEPVGELVELALRRNPEASASAGVHGAGQARPGRSAQSCTRPGCGWDGPSPIGLPAQPALVIGYAETATGLGHCVAEALGADYLHSTRRTVAGSLPAGGFEEQHSHATGHLLLPEDPALLSRPGVVVLVDDEFSTGATALNTIAELQRLHAAAALRDRRARRPPHADRPRAHDRCGRPAGHDRRRRVPGQRCGQLARRTSRRSQRNSSPSRRDGPLPVARAEVIEVPARWTAREGGRHGFAPADQLAARAAAADQAVAVQPQGPRVLVLGTEELMYAPLLIALELAERADLDVRFSSSTRSPVLAVDEPGYPIRSVLTFAAHDGTGPRYAYNVSGGFDDIVVVLDSDEPGLIAALRTACKRVHVVRLPSYRPLPPALRSPEFGSYRDDEVAWLLTDLSGVALEAPIEEREEAVQSGGAHYAESLPIEYQPTAEYQALFAARARRDR